jgi:hypothetical protein
MAHSKLSKFKDSIILILEKEIQFHKIEEDRRTFNFRTKGYREGFIKGINQAKFLISNLPTEE